MDNVVNKERIEMIGFGVNKYKLNYLI